ncbi:MAG: molybdopterin biosynthesis protein MoeA [Methanosaeta sp. PtaU1.Bin060]|nr:MAG: molybdopterin biosynthesis protein MoeA [Methanosaeta sp. PtaU1.Bin060]
MPKEFRTLIPLEEARSIVLSHALYAEMETVSLQGAIGRVLAEKIVSGIDVPGFYRASMDGYAVHSEDTTESREDRPVSLHLVGSVPMGTRPEVQVRRDEAAEVSTGSMMPPGADAVVMIEYSEAKENQVLVRRPVYSGENVQAAGGDISLGEVLLFPGTKLAAREIGVLAALGRDNVSVRSVKVGVASTGNELVPPGSALGPGKIYDINSYSIASAAEECGATPVMYGILPDEEAAMEETLRKMARECDLVLVSGSTSAGAGDMIYRVLDEIGEMLFHGVNLKPGKPTLFGTIEGKPCLGLPGYPTSALTVFGLLAAPAIRKALGLRASAKMMTGRLSRPVRAEGRQQMLAVGISGDVVYTADKGSGSITTLAGADGVIEIPAGVEYLEQGMQVDVRLFGDLELPDLVVAGENSLLLDRLVESAPLKIRLLNTGSLLGIIHLQDGVADVASVMGSAEPPSGVIVLGRCERELGLIFRDEDALQEIAKMDIVGWRSDSMMKAAFESALEDMGVASPKYVRLARSHSAVAAAVAAGMADLGFGERDAAMQAGLGFKLMMKDEIRLLTRAGEEERADIQDVLVRIKAKGMR